MKKFNSRFKSILVLLALCVSSVLSAGEQTPTKDKSKFHIYLLIGQSNMAGRAKIVGEDKKPIKGAFLLNSEDKWQVAVPPLNLYSTVRKDAKMQKLNPGVYFAKTMLKKNPDINIGMVVNAKGGSKIQEWNERDTQFYIEALRRIKIAIKSGTLKGILWHQGEANHKDPDYIEKVSKLIQHFREDLKMPNLPVVAGQINGESPFNKLILTLPEKVKNTAVASTEGLTATDRWHFDTPSMRKLGERYANKMMEVQKKATAK